MSGIHCKIVSQMKINSSIRNIILIWLGWAIILIAFQHWVEMRVELRRPDHFLDPVQEHSPYLDDPFLNSHVSWDSEFYLSIATAGYDDPSVRAIPPTFIWKTAQQVYCIAGKDTNCISLNYAFFPLYPWVIRLFAYPLQLLNLTLVAGSTLAGIIISLVGALGAMLALYFMTRTSLDEEGGIRTAFYFLIFPSSFFMAQVYTEGLFISLTFGALAFLMARKWVLSAFLALLAVWTRPGGAILLVPMAMVWWMDKPWKDGWKSALLRALAALTPAISYGVWSLTPLAAKFHIVEDHYFARGLLAIGPSIQEWERALNAFLTGDPPYQFYFGLEFAGIALAVISCVLLWKERPELAAFSIVMVGFVVTSGIAQSMIRYVLATPALFWVLARWGKKPAFDRIWTIVSILLLGLEVMLFSFDFWVG
jgi:Gpi18-like mannosyltransferase